MSTENLNLADEPSLFWHDGLNPADYLTAVYVVETRHNPNSGAAAIALEQSVSGLFDPFDGGLDQTARTGRVRDVVVLGQTEGEVCPPYRLNTAVYQAETEKQGPLLSARIEIAFPLINLGSGVVSLLNSVYGEVPRLGIFTAARLEELHLPEGYLAGFPGPRYGVEGLREKWRVRDRPFLCRAARPAVGVSDSVSARVFGEVLRGGFDFVKDDELTTDGNPAAMAGRLRAVLPALAEAQKETGEAKGYIVNLIDDPEASWRRLAIAEREGAHGVLVAPSLQGLGFLKELRKRSELMVLAHNTGLDGETRPPRWGVHPAVHILLQRLCGADMVMMPGATATPYQDRKEVARCLAACFEPLSSIARTLPVIAGGKKPDEMAGYLSDMGGADFCAIVATSVDSHPEGLRAGAAAFRKVTG